MTDKEIATAYKQLSPKGRLLFELIAFSDKEWISSSALYRLLGQRRLSGSDERQLKRMIDSKLIYKTQFRAAYIDYPNDRHMREMLYRQRRQQQWVNVYALNEMAIPLANKILELKQKREQERQKAHRREEIRRYGRLKLFLEDLAFAWGMVWDELRGRY